MAMVVVDHGGYDLCVVVTYELKPRSALVRWLTYPSK